VLSSGFAGAGFDRDDVSEPQAYRKVFVRLFPSFGGGWMEFCINVRSHWADGSLGFYYMGVVALMSMTGLSFCVFLSTGSRGLAGF